MDVGATLLLPGGASSFLTVFCHPEPLDSSAQIHGESAKLPLVEAQDKSHKPAHLVPPGPPGSSLRARCFCWSFELAWSTAPLHRTVASPLTARPWFVTEL